MAVSRYVRMLAVGWLGMSLGFESMSLTGLLCVVVVRTTHRKSKETGRKVNYADVKRRFTPVTRQLCLQHHARGFGYKRISKATSIPTSTIKYHVRKQRGVVDGSSGSDDGARRLEHAAPVISVPLPCPPPVQAALIANPVPLKQKTGSSLEKSIALVGMMHAVHDVIHKNVYAFARALQFDSHGAPGLMNAADPQMATLALNLLLQDPWAERQELAALGRILLQRLYRARDFLRSAISLCQNVVVSSPIGESLGSGGGGGSSPAVEARYWECPVCSKRLVYTGKSAHMTRCLKKCKVLLSHEQLQAAKAAAATAVAHSGHPGELKHQLKHVLTLKAEEKQCQQVRYMQLVVAVNTSLQQDVDAAPGAILKSREAWRALQCGPNPVVAALALASLAPQSQRSERKTSALVSNYAHDLANKVAGQIVAVEAFLTRCVAVGAPSPTAVDAHDAGRGHLAQQQHERDELHSRRVTCTCHRVRISALIHPCVSGA